MKRLLFLSLSAISLLRGESLTLNNNSTYKLTAEIYNAVGDKEASVALKPGQIYMWYSDQSPFVKQYDQPYTPYVVRWRCSGTRPYNYNPPPKEKGAKPDEYLSEYGSWEQVPPGAMVTALGSPSGSKTCVIQKKQPQKQPQKRTPPPVQKPNKNEGFNNFSNDGGKSWSNDGGELEEEDEGKGHYEELPP